jgi:hypothetical protein
VLGGVKPYKQPKIIKPAAALRHCAPRLHGWSLSLCCAQYKINGWYRSSVRQGPTLAPLPPGQADKKAAAEQERQLKAQEKAQQAEAKRLAAAATEEKRAQLANALIAEEEQEGRRLAAKVSGRARSCLIIRCIRAVDPKSLNPTSHVLHRHAEAEEGQAEAGEAGAGEAGSRAAGAGTG